jgi:hypothetical protein
MRIGRALAIIVTIALLEMMATTAFGREMGRSTAEAREAGKQNPQSGSRVFILAAHFRILAHIELIGFARMLPLLISTLAIGCVLDGNDSRGRRSPALIASLRDVGVGLVIAAGVFCGTPAVFAVLSYRISEVFGSPLLVIRWGCQASAGIGILKGAAE